jgi:hypothetical protein
MPTPIATQFKATKVLQLLNIDIPDIVWTFVLFVACLNKDVTAVLFFVRAVLHFVQTRGLIRTPINKM